MSDFERQRAIPNSRMWLFRCIAFVVPTLIGVAILLKYMQHFHFFAKDEQGKTFVRRPLYLQEPGHETTGHKYLYDSRLGWKNIPNFSSTTFGKPLNINAEGLRDRSYPYQKPAGASRILVLGDSFTWGYGVGDQEIFTEVLEAKLAQSSRRWEVINTGVSGWGTDQQYLFLNQEGFQYDPDIVLLAFFLMNDPVENVSARVYEMNKPLFLDTALNLGNVPVLKPVFIPDVRSTVDPIVMTLAIMKAMAQRCEEHESELVIMKFGRFLRPDLEVLLNDEKVVESAVRDWENVRYLDLDAAFAQRQITTQRLVEGNHDGHWNAFGHEVVGEVLYEFLNGPVVSEARGVQP